MKIVIFAPFYAPHIGGVEKFIEDLNVHLSKKGVDITIFTPKIPAKTKTTQIIHNISIIRFPAWEVVKNYPFPKFWDITFWRLLKHLKREKPDIIVSHTRFFITSLIALIYAKKNHLPLLHIEHGSSFTQNTNSLIAYCAWLYDQTLGRLVLQKADYIVSISEAVQKFVITLSPKTKQSVIYRGFDTNIIKSINDKEINYTKPIITYIGRLTSSKGIQELIEALNIIKTESWTCIIGGDGENRFALEKLTAHYSLGDRVHFLGHLKHQDALSLIKASDVFVNPSHSEGLPTTVAEAALCGKAIVATDVGGTREIIEHNKSGLLIPAKDPSCLAKSILIFLKDAEKRISYGTTAKQKMSFFSWEKTCDQYLKIFENI